MKIDIDEVGKHKKKRESDISKSSKKANHKHTKVECLLHVKEYVILGRTCEQYCHASYCGICGKVHNVAFTEVEKTDNGTYKILKYNEVFEKYKDLDIIEVDNVWIKYLPIEVKNENN